MSRVSDLIGPDNRLSEFLQRATDAVSDMPAERRQALDKSARVTAEQWQAAQHWKAGDTALSLVEFSGLSAIFGTSAEFFNKRPLAHRVAALELMAEVYGADGGGGKAVRVDPPAPVGSGGAVNCPF